MKTKSDRIPVSARPNTARLAKINKPTASGLIPRSRLFRLLDQHRARPSFWLSAPAGAGKTSLLTSYVQAQNLSCLWYQVDTRDADLATFFHYLRLAARRAAPRSRRPLPTFTSEYLADVSAFTRTYFEILFTLLKPPALAVFDNVQEAPAEVFGQLLCDVAPVVPPGVCVVLLSRSDPPPALARLQAHRDMALLRWNELRLTADEAYRIARERGYTGRGRLSRKAVARLHEEAEGWIAGLLLMLEHDLLEEAPLSPTVLQGRQTVFDYLASELFDRADPNTQDFLLCTAQLGQFTPELAARLTGNARSIAILKELRHRNYFLTIHGKAAGVCTYHPLFQGFLREEARRVFSPSELSALKREAAELLAGIGQIEEAVELLRNADDLHSLADLTVKQAPTLVSQGRDAVLRCWLEYLPESMRHANPWLLYWHGISQHVSDPATSRQLYEQAFHRFRDQRQREGALLAWCGIADSFILQQSDFTSAGPWIDALEQMLAESAAFPSAEIELRVTSSLVGILLYHRPDHSDLPERHTRLSTLIREVPDEGQRLAMGGTLLLYLIWRGYPQEAETLVNSLRPTYRASKTRQAKVILWYVLEALSLWMQADFKGCLKAVDTGLQLGKEAGVHILDSNLLTQGAYASLSIGELEEARGYLDRMQPLIHPARRLDVAHYLFVRGWWAVLSGEPERALNHIQASLETVQELGVPLPTLLTKMAVASALCELGRYAAAGPFVDGIRCLGEAMGSRIVMINHDLLQAEMALANDDSRAAQGWLKSGFALGMEIGDVNYAWLRPKVLARLCARALAFGVEVDFVTNLVRRRQLQPEELPLELTSWPWPFRIYTLGRFELVRDGQPIRSTGKAQKRPLEMLKVLIALGGSGVSQTQMTEALWPDTDGDTAHRSFATTLHRLRRLLGDPQSLQLHDGLLTLDPNRCWVDLWAFERILGQAIAVIRHGDGRTAWQLTEPALELYQGDFLGREGLEPWALPIRERLRSRLLSHLKRVSASLCNAKLWEDSISIYQKALEVDHLAEDCYRGLMACYQRLGRPAEGLAVYQRCRQVLGTILGVEPSHETRTLMHKLREMGDQGVTVK